ncbi:arylesterase [Candidatus Gracilibacteria bacterium]|nr:arylesterase [Candidatus Gracilibacteria bacterium]
MKIFIISLIFLSTLIACSKTDTASDTIPLVQTQKTILALGDSLTAGYGLPETDSYPSQLQKKLKEKGYDYQIQNAGISGDTSAGLLSRMDWILDSTGSSATSATEYTLAILCIGGNDAFQGKSPEDIEKNIRAIVEKLQAKKIPILFAGMKAPLNLGAEYGKQYEAIFPKLAKEYNLVYMDFFLDGVALKANLNQDDRIHPTREGYVIIVDNLMKILEDEKLIIK